MINNKEEIWKLDDLDCRVVTIPGWGDLRLKCMSVGDQLKFEELDKSKLAEGDNVFNIICLTCVDEHGNYLFDLSDIPNLKKKSTKAILTLFQECLKINSMESNSVQDNAKNS